MSFKSFPDQQQGISLLQRSLQKGRLGHGYAFIGDLLSGLEELARTLAKTLNCETPVLREGARIDCCDQCLSCLKIEHDNHPDVHYVRPESKTRIITVDQMRELMREIQLKPAEAGYKVAVIVASDRMRAEAGNAFLKTLEEPPAKSVLILLTTEPQRMLDTILSRCLRLTFAGASAQRLSGQTAEWLGSFARTAAAEQKSLLARYRLMDSLLKRLNGAKATIEKDLSARSPLEQYADAEKDLVEKWEAELSAAVEAEYRRQRSDTLKLLQAWFRDVWLMTLNGGTGDRGERRSVDRELLTFPELPGTAEIAARLSPTQATENLQILEQLQRWLSTNVQEALALEVGLLKLSL